MSLVIYYNSKFILYNIREALLSSQKYHEQIICPNLSRVHALVYYALIELDSHTNGPYIISFVATMT